MNVSQASKIWLDYHRAHSKENTIRAYEFTIAKFNQNFANLNLHEVSTDDILDFMNQFTEDRKPQTKRIRFSHLTAFFHFLRNNFDGDIQNPCDLPMLRKLFRPKAVVHWDIIEKETVDEIIFRTDKERITSRLRWSIESEPIWTNRNIAAIWGNISKTLFSRRSQYAYC
jgi:site-specific recombinase XerD